VVSAAREGDAYALAELDRFNEYLARAIAMLVFVLAPQIVVLGTIAAAAGESLCLAPLRERVAGRVWPILAHAVRIEATALGSERADLAGLCVALQALESPSSS
jgi:glucokinase